jgi:hypothetical protein
MRPYADVASRRMLQIIADVVALLAIIVFVRVGMAVHDMIASFAVWGERIESAGERLSNSLTNIGETLGNIPLIGGLIGDPFSNASKAAAEWQEVGQDIQDRIGALAVSMGIMTALVPILFVLLIWLVPRLRFAVRAARVRTVAMSPAGRDLLALRALASAPVQDLQAISPDVAAAWRANDDATITALAALTLNRAGVKMPAKAISPAAASVPVAVVTVPAASVAPPPPAPKPARTTASGAKAQATPSKPPAKPAK